MCRLQLCSCRMSDSGDPCPLSQLSTWNLLLLVYCSSIISLVAPRCDSVRGASRAFATIEIRTAQTVAKIRNGHRAKSDEAKFDRLRAKAKIGNNELSITKNASI